MAATLDNVAFAGAPLPVDNLQHPSVDACHTGKGVDEQRGE